MNYKLMYALLFACIAIVPQVERYKAITWTKTIRYHPHELEYYRACEIWVTIDPHLILVGDDRYDILKREKMDADSVQMYECVHNKLRCRFTVDRKVTAAFDAQCMIFYGDDSARIYKMFRDL